MLCQDVRRNSETGPTVYLIIQSKFSISRASKISMLIRTYRRIDSSYRPYLLQLMTSSWHWLSSWKFSTPSDYPSSNWTCNTHGIMDSRQRVISLLIWNVKSGNRTRAAAQHTVQRQHRQLNQNHGRPCSQPVVHGYKVKRSPGLLVILGGQTKCSENFTISFALHVVEFLNCWI